MPSVGQKVQGSEKKLVNGATGHSVWMKKKDGSMGKRFQLTSGASKQYLDTIRKMPRKQITEKQAQAAFDRHYNNAANFKTPRAQKASRTRDLNFASEVRKTSTYGRNPSKYDYPNVDLGTRTRKPASAAQKAALAKGRAALAAKRAAQKGGYWW